MAYKYSKLSYIFLSVFIFGYLQSKVYICSCFSIVVFACNILFLRLLYCRCLLSFVIRMILLS